MNEKEKLTVDFSPSFLEKFRGWCRPRTTQTKAAHIALELIQHLPADFREIVTLAYSDGGWSRVDAWIDRGRLRGETGTPDQATAVVGATVAKVLPQADAKKAGKKGA